MCYHLASKSKIEELQARFEAEFSEPHENEYYHVSGFAHPSISVTRSDKQNAIQLSAWGLIPVWIMSEKQAPVDGMYTKGIQVCEKTNLESFGIIFK